MILPGRATGSAYFKPASGTARSGRRLFGKIGERLEIAIAPPQHLAEIGRQARVHRLQIDDGVALDHAQPQTVVGFKTDDFHEIASPNAADPAGDARTRAGFVSRRRAHVL